jgi:hypothetical protein
MVISRRHGAKIAPKAEVTEYGSRGAQTLNLAAPVSHQKRPNQSATNAIEFKRKDSKINEADRYSAAHNGPVAGSSPDEPFTTSAADHLHSGERLRATGPRNSSQLSP